MRKLKCKYCGKKLDDLPFIKSVKGFISHPKCYIEAKNKEEELESLSEDKKVRD